MSQKLEQIRALIAETEQTLKDINPMPLSRSEAKTAAHGRRILRTELIYLREQEAIEVTRIQASAD